MNPKSNSQKTVLITGSTGGIGIETAIGVAKKGAEVLVTARNPEKGLKGVERIMRETGNEAVKLFLVDFTSPSQIRSFVEEVQFYTDSIDVLVNNVGGGSLERKETQEGQEATFALNHLSHYMVTHLLMDQLLAAPAGRIVNVTSGLHYWVEFDFEDVQTRSNYMLPHCYAKAKMANLMWAFHLADQLKNTSVTVNMADPGLSMTDGLDTLIGQVDTLNLRWANPFYHYAQRAFTPKQAAKSTIYLATSQLLGDMHGAYLDPEKKVITAADAAYHIGNQQKICELSVAITEVPWEIRLPDAENTANLALPGSTSTAQ